MDISLLNERDLRAIDLNLLLYFHAIMTERNVSAAAKRLHVTQSALSHALNRLREIFSDPLFVRIKTGVEPTEYAKKIYAVIHDALMPIGQLLSSEKEFRPAEFQGGLKISMDDYTAQSLGAQMAYMIGRAAPRCQLRILPFHLEQTARDLARGLIDFALRVDVESAEGIYKEVVRTEGFITLCRPGHELANKKMTLKRYLEASHVLVSPQGMDRGTLDGILEKMGCRRFVRVILPYFGTAPWVILRGDDLVTLPESIGRLWAKQLGLVVHQPPVEVPQFPMHLVWHERVKNSAVHQWMRGMVRQAAAEV